MPVPFETLIPYGLVILMFGITGGAVSASAYVQNGYKPKRWAVDNWDTQMMERDQRLTNIYRGQSDRPRAPKGYELSSKWRLQARIT